MTPMTIPIMAGVVSPELEETDGDAVDDGEGLRGWEEEGMAVVAKLGRTVNDLEVAGCTVFEAGTSRLFAI